MNLPVRELGEHDELFRWLLEGEPVVLVNLDAHSDMAMFDGSLGIGNFISKLMRMKKVTEVFWVRDPRSIDFEDGVHEFAIGQMRSNSLALAASLPRPFYFVQGSYLEKGQMLSPTTAQMTVVSDPNRLPGLKGRPWVLSVDFDYFSCRNPNAGALAGFVRALGPDFIGDFYRRGKAIRTKNEWGSFAQTAEAHYPGITQAVAGGLFPEYAATRKEIQAKILAANRWLTGSADFSLCRGLYSVDSLESGFTGREEQNMIRNHVKPWFSVLKRASQ